MLTNWFGWNVEMYDGIGREVRTVLETLDTFWVMFWRTDYVVWWIAGLMATIAGFILHGYSDNTLMSNIGAAALFVAILLAHTAFALLGIAFHGNKSANAIVAAGLAICSVFIVWIVIYRILVTIGDVTNPLKGDDPAQIG